MRHSIRQNVAYNFIYQILLIIVPLVLTPYLARTLGSTGLGLYSYHYSCTYYFVMVATLGLQTYGSRSIARVSDDREECAKTFSSIFSLQLCTSGLALTAYLLYMVFIRHGEPIVVVMSGFVLACALDITWFYAGIEYFKLTVLRNTIIKIGTLLCTLLLVREPGDVVKYACIMAGGTALSNLSLWVPLHRYVSWRRPARKDVLKHLKPTLIIFATAFSVSLYINMDKIMLGQMTNMSEVGFYESSEKFLNLPMLLPTALNTVMVAHMSHIAGGEKTEETRLTNLSMEFAMAITSALCFGLAAIADMIVPLFLGAGFEKCIRLLLILMPSRLFVCFTNVITAHCLLPYNRDWLFMGARLSGAVVNICANLYLIPRFASEGAAVATLLAEAAVCGVQCWPLRKDFPIGQYLKNVLPYICSGAAMFAGVKFVESCLYLGTLWQLVITVGAGAILYFLCVLGWIVLFHQCSAIELYGKDVLYRIKSRRKKGV